MRSIALFIAITALVLAPLGCATAPHPLLRAFAPSNLPSTLLGSSTVNGRAYASAKLPLLPQAYILAEQHGDQIVVKIRPPFNTEEFMEHYRKELAKRSVKNVRVVSAERGE